MLGLDTNVPSRRKRMRSTPSASRSVDDRALRVLVQHEQDADDDADDDALEEVEREHRGDGYRERQQLGQSQLHLHPEHRRFAQVEADLNQHGGKARQRNAIDQRTCQHDGHEQQCAVHERRESLLGTGRDVGAAPHDHRGERQAAERTRDGVGHALRQQLAIWWAVTLERIQSVHRLERQQRFNARDDGDRHAGDPGGRDTEGCQVRLRQRAVERDDAAERHVDVVLRVAAHSGEPANTIASTLASTTTIRAGEMVR